ncbi:MAG TPA: hypothetical protein VHD56_17785 [Tepidisphaeraceae bacterium]|nr:hypothetical protein [Tepidisphaeraceae bacterium]
MRRREFLEMGLSAAALALIPSRAIAQSVKGVEGVQPPSTLPTGSTALKSARGGWRAEIAPNGAIRHIQFTFADVREIVPWNTGDHFGPTWEGVNLSPMPGTDFGFAGTKDGISYAILYGDDNGRFTITARVKNEGTTAFRPERARLRLGIDNAMNDYRDGMKSSFPPCCALRRPTSGATS